MIGLLITGHGQFATGLKSSLELITGITEHIKYVDFPGDSTEVLAAEQNKALDELKDCDGVLIQECCRVQICTPGSEDRSCSRNQSFHDD